MARQRFLWLVPFLGLILPWFSVSAGTVLSSSKFAWSNNLGYINFENLVVDDYVLSGFAWSEHAGWIKFNPALGGVSNDGVGHLSGFAWGEQLGWIDFGGVFIDPSTGVFSGTATGTLAGIITFDCPTYCDVRTDWREASVAPVVASGVGGGSYIPIPPPPSTSVPTSTYSVPELPSVEVPSTQTGLEHVEVHNEPLSILPEQSGTSIQDTAVGQVIIEVPPHNVIGPTTFILSEVPLAASTRYLVVGDRRLVNDTFYDVSARDAQGNPVYAFSSPITITLPLSANLLGEKNLAVYWLNETNKQWVLIPDAVFSAKKVTFRVNHLTRFAIFRAVKSTPTKVTSQTPSRSISIPAIEGFLKPSEPRTILPVEEVKGIVRPTTTSSIQEETKETIFEKKKVIRKTAKKWMVPVLALTLALISSFFLLKEKRRRDKRKVFRIGDKTH